MGIVRGKSDSIDAKHIARYVYEKREIIKTSNLSSTVLIKLKKYLSLRDSLVKSSTGFKANYTESKRVYSEDEYGDYLQILREQINHFQQEINKVEKIITGLINTDDSLKKQYDLLNSIKGLGKVIIPYMLAYTDAFTKFDSARKFASYIGVAPFPHQSGTSIRGKNRTSKLAHRKLNSLLEMGARSAIQFDMELKAYYERKRIEGKEKEAVINAVKNKLIARAFAVIKRETPFVDIMKFAA
jgi:transposase